MEIILSKTCVSITGALNKRLGYSIQRQRGKFVSKRNSRGSVPPDGHWRFIVLCAEQAQIGFLFSDIIVPRKEVLDALREAGIHGIEPVGTYHANDIIHLKNTYGL